jgi:hypothetical protein
MKDYITSLLPRLKQYSRSLNDTALLADHPWVFIDADGKKLTHIFRRDGQLLVSVQGEVVKGKWEYLPAINSLLIEYSGKSWLYNQGFVDPAILVMQKDDTEDLFVLANQNMIPDLDVFGYLSKKLSPPTNISNIASKADDKPVIDYQTVDLKSPQLTIRIKKLGGGIYGKGNRVEYLDGTPLENGGYNTKNGFKIIIKDGVITDTKATTVIPTMIIFVLCVCLIIFLILYFI